MTFKPKVHSLNINIVKIAVFVLFGGIFFVGNAYAQSDTTTLSEQFFEIGNFFIWILSWLWILLASWAGKFMTNDFVYWAFINLDKNLFYYWNIMKNMANFTLGFIMLFYIFKWLINPTWDWVYWIIKTKFAKIIIAMVAIQASWFFVAAIIDISTIVTVTVSSLPAHVISNSEDMSVKYKQATENFTKKKYTLDIDFEKNAGNWQIEETQLTGTQQKEMRDNLLPHEDNLSWPLMFIWVSIFEFQNFTSPQLATDKWVWRGEALASLGINFFFILVYTLSLAFILLFNIFRMLALWIIIPLMPLIIVAIALEFKIEEKNIASLINVKSILNLIFKPVFYALYLSISMILLILMYGMMNNHWKQEVDNQWNITIENGNGESTVDILWVLEFNLKSAKNSLSSLFVFFLAIGMMRLLMQLAVKQSTWIGFVDDKMNTLWKTAESGFWAVPIVPLGNWKWVWLNAISQTANDISRTNPMQDRLNTQTSNMREFFNLESPEKLLRKYATTDSIKFKSTLKQAMEEKHPTRKWELSTYYPYIKDWMKKYHPTDYERFWKKLSDTTLETNNNNRNSLAKLLWIHLYQSSSNKKNTLFDLDKPIPDNTANTPS